MRHITNEVLSADWQPYRIANTDEPNRPRSEWVGGADDVIYVRTVYPAAPVAPRPKTNPRWFETSLAVGAFLAVLGVWKLWELSAAAVLAAYRLFGG